MAGEKSQLLEQGPLVDQTPLVELTGYKEPWNLYIGEDHLSPWPYEISKHAILDLQKTCTYTIIHTNVVTYHYTILYWKKQLSGKFDVRCANCLWGSMQFLILHNEEVIVSLEVQFILMFFSCDLGVFFHSNCMFSSLMFE